MNLFSLHHFITLSLLLPAISTRSTNITTPSNPATSYRCYPLRVFALRLGLVQNCAGAILSLPQDAQPVSFHSAGPSDVGRLPITRTCGDCTVKVELIDSEEVSTWTAVNLVASLLMTACIDISLNTPYTGGYASAGNGGRVKVTLQRSEEGVGVGNASSLLSE